MTNTTAGPTEVFGELRDRLDPGMLLAVGRTITDWWATIEGLAFRHTSHCTVTGDVNDPGEAAFAPSEHCAACGDGTINYTEVTALPGFCTCTVRTIDGECLERVDKPLCAKCAPVWRDLLGQIDPAYAPKEN